VEPFKNLLDLLLDLEIVEPTEKLIAEDRAKTAISEDVGQIAKPNSGNNFTEGIPRKTVADQLQPALNSSDRPQAKETLPANSAYLRQQITVLEQKLANSENQMEELTELVNSLIPLIAELLRLKSNDLRESIVETIVPIIDEIITQRSAQDRQRMGAALAYILPAAIARAIDTEPQSIAKAIAPEVALAIQEQIRLDRDSISQTLGPEMGHAIKTQIELERDAMVDALYPVIGSTISKYMVEVVKTINEKVESTLSPEGIKRKIRAKIQGVSEAELILQESIKYQVRAIFLIHKASGLVIREVQPDSQYQLESDLVAGMLTAIRSFANECIASSSELDEIDYGDSKIILEVAGYCYIAVVVKGEPPKKFIRKIRNTLGQIVIKYGRIMEAYDGDPTTIPEPVQLLLEKLIEPDDRQQEQSKKPTALLWLLAMLLGMVVVPWGIVQYRSNVGSRIEQETAIALDAAPELSVYRLIPEVRRGKLILTGRVPSEYLRQLATAVAATIAERKNLEVNNQILAVNVPPDPSLTAQEIKRVTSLLNQQEGVAITSQYQTKTVTVEGFILDRQATQFFIAAFEQIPGVDTVVFAVEKQLPQLTTRIYFEPNSTALKSADISSKIKSIHEFLEQYPQLNLQLVGYSDRSGSQQQNLELGRERARAVREALISLGVSPARLQITASAELPPDVTPSQPLWLSRCVRFEPFISSSDNYLK
jgi:outer membrane protein OmpA-like peptidoglycan-associated protein